MRKLLLFFAMLIVSIGAWADKDVAGKYKLTTDNQIWHQGKDDQQTVVKIYLYAPNYLGEALQDLESQNIDYQMLYISGIGSDPNQILDLTDSDLEALSNVNVETIDMRNLITASAFTFTNQYVKSVILPSSFGKAEVKAAGLALAQSNNFGSCFSMRKGIYAPYDLDDDKNPITYTEGTINGYASNESGSVIAYVAKPNTLRHAILHSYFNTKNNTILRHQGFDGDNEAAQSLRSFTVMGYPSASDMATQGDWNENGHFVPNCTAYEYSISANAGGFDGKTTRMSYYDGTNKRGALWGAGLIMLDMSDAVIDEQYNSDMTLTWLGSCCSQLEQVWLPTSSLVKTIPADFAMSDWHYLRQIYIPANIENIKTRAFYGSTRNLCHIWTAGPNENTIYDNGAWVTDGSNDTNTSNDTHFFGMAHLGSLGNPTEAASNKTYGTFTFSPNLKCIESHAFNSDRVKDVYCLGTTAPECHVDAFNATMYIANNDYKTDQITSEGIITREAYTNNVTNRMYMTMLHYPRETVTPDIQHYTDPTRAYSVATGLRDGRGNNIYFPVQTEYLRAYGQGTTGYLWEAWDGTKNWYDYEFKNDPLIVSEHTTEAQQKANNAWLNNPDTEGKADRSFYDVRLDQTGQPSLPQPAGLDWYYNTVWEKKQLYQQMETSQTETVIGQVQKKDENGNLLYKDCPGEGDYVKDFNYVEKSDGEYVKVSSVSGYESSNQPVEGVSSYYSDDKGATEAIPKVGNGFYYVSGEHDVYTAVDKNNSANIGTQAPYYTKSGDTYTESNLMFNTTYYYPTGKRITVPKYVSCNYTTYDPTKTYYTESNGVYTEVLPNFNGSTYYYVNGEYKQTSVAIAGVTKYYQNYGGWTEVMPQITQYYYYADGTEEIDEWIGSDHFIADKNWYSYDQNNKTYNAITLNWHNHFTGDYYYVSGSAPTYTSAQGLNYDATATYYDVNGTEATSITFDQSYYYPVYAYSYEDYSGQAGDRYTKEYYYRLAENGETGDYCPDMDNVYGVEKGTQYDYRGWHQFVLTGYATNSKIEFEPVRWFINDNDWWTICVPYDLKYSDMIMFFGTEAKEGSAAKLPYLSKLKYVVRDQENEKITLTFSKNLMEYKEMIPGSTNAISGTSYNHGFIDDVTKWTESEIRQDPVILHAGVPYLIKPNMTKENGSFKRQFDIFSNTKADLYSRLHASSALNGRQQMEMIYKGEYTVPAYVVGSGNEETQESLTITNQDDSEFTYNSGQVKYKGENVNYKISKDFNYTFVGSFYKSAMPKYCYFLGWDAKQNKAAFWYNRVLKENEWDWNNETAVICPNFKTDKEIDPAASLKDPARWILTDSDLALDDFSVGGNAKTYTMEFGAVDNIEWNEATGVSEMEVKPLFEDTKVYDVNGRYLGSSLQNLPKGIYVVNGKKYVVK